MFHWIGWQKIFVITVKGLKPATFCVRDHDATTAPAWRMWETGSLNWAQFILQWFSDFLNSLNSVHRKILNSTGPNVFIFKQLLANFDQIISWRTLRLLSPYGKSQIHGCPVLQLLHCNWWLGRATYAVYGRFFGMLFWRWNGAVLTH